MYIQSIILRPVNDDNQKVFCLRPIHIYLYLCLIVGSSRYIVVRLDVILFIFL